MCAFREEGERALLCQSLQAGSEFPGVSLGEDGAGRWLPWALCSAVLISVAREREDKAAPCALSGSGVLC